MIFAGVVETLALIAVASYLVKVALWQTWKLLLINSIKNAVVRVGSRLINGFLNHYVDAIIDWVIKQLTVDAAGTPTATKVYAE